MKNTLFKTAALTILLGGAAACENIRPKDTVATKPAKPLPERVPVNRAAMEKAEMAAYQKKYGLHEAPVRNIKGWQEISWSDSSLSSQYYNVRDVRKSDSSKELKDLSQHNVDEVEIATATLDSDNSDSMRTKNFPFAHIHVLKRHEKNLSTELNQSIDSSFLSADGKTFYLQCVEKETFGLGKNGRYHSKHNTFQFVNLKNKTISSYMDHKEVGSTRPVTATEEKHLFHYSAEDMGLTLSMRNEIDGYVKKHPELKHD